MSCERFEDQLADDLGGELSGSSRLEFESHLRRCPSCRQEAETLREVVSTLDALGLPDVGPPPVRSARFWRVARRSLAYAAVLGAGIIIGWSAKSPALQQDVAPSSDVAPIRLAQFGPVHPEWLSTGSHSEAPGRGGAIVRNLSTFTRALGDAAASP